MSDQKFKQVGTRPIRHDGFDKVTGRANFGADYTLPGMLEGAVLRSPHAHARILSIDTSEAEQLDGVHAVITSADLPDIPRSGDFRTPHMDIRDLSHNVLAHDKVLYHGHAIAAVAARTVEIAREACERIRVEYEVLSPVMDLDTALAADGPVLLDDLKTASSEPHPDGPTNLAAHTVMERGDIEKGFAEAEVVVERDYETAMVHQGYIEPHAVVARTHKDGQALVWCCTQGPFMVRSLTSAILGMEVSDVKVIPSEIGGGFGGKTTVYLEPLAVVLSRKSGRPVKLVMSREEVFRATGPTSPGRVYIKFGARRDGTLTAASTVLTYEAGAYPGSPVGAGTMTVLSPYRLENFRIEGLDVVTNKPKVAAYRAPGAPIAAFGIEQALDELALELGMDPIEFRLINAVEEGDDAAYGPKYQAIGFRETLETARKHPHYSAPLGPNQGRGIASGFWFNAGLQSSAQVSINEDGTAIVTTGNPDIGGSRASQAIMVAEELGIDALEVTPVVGDTESVGYSDVTGGSRTAYATGMAVIEATRDCIDQLRARAAQIWNVEVDSVAWDDGFAKPTNGASGDLEPLSLRDISSKLGMTGGPILASASLNPPMAGPGFATHLCDVEVDPETGRVDVIRYTAIQDAGRAVHPSYVEGQFQGGAVQGIGWALNEEYIFDADGVLENPGFLDYRMPVASDLPMIDTVIVEVPNPLHPYGVRGVGETPIVPPLAAVANAVHAASGVRFEQLPITPPRVLAALEEAKD
ncbi:xanthine dehydrogenase family protein molybdopterin-binding subunit [Myxococcota bacterium]|nr:xanthine dehydrogenase family protein molybdopterin-binding subunit [Myxococcota bacterium]